MGRTTSLTLSADEVASKRLSPASLAAGVASLREHGFVLIENAVPLPLLRRVAHRMQTDTPTMLQLAHEMHGRAPHVYTYGNLQQDPPFTLAECCGEEILANPWAIEIASEASDGAPRLAPHYTGNTNLPGSRTQPVHRDSSHRVDPLTRFVVNICPCDTTLVNGAIELWPGTHIESEVERDEREARYNGDGAQWGGEFPRHHWAARRELVPPIRACAPIVVLTVAAPEDSDATADQPTRVMQFEQGCEHAIEVVQANPRVAFPRAEFVDAEELIYTVALRDGKPDRSGGLYDDTAPLMEGELDDEADGWARWWWVEGGRHGKPRL